MYKTKKDGNNIKIK